MLNIENESLLVLNAGSSSLKFAVYQRNEQLPLLLKGSISSLGHEPRLKIISLGRVNCDRTLTSGPMGLDKAVEEVFAELARREIAPSISAVGHRIVHGGSTFNEPALLDEKVLTQLRGFVPLAPLHQPYNLDIVEASVALLPNAQQVGCFDTSFHSRRPRVDRLYGLPRALSDEGVLAYGFHGLSYAHIAKVLKDHDGERAGGRAIVAHLGSGASLCAMNAGRSVATTMGFSALEGLVMSSRCGSIDPGVILHLMDHYGMDHQALTELLYKRSGLLGVSDISADMQTLLASESAHAEEAIDLYIYRISRAMGSLVAALGGLDTLIFTAGVGENAPIIRQRIADAAHWLGIRVDNERNENAQTRINTPDSTVDVLVVPTDEELAVAMGVLVCAGTKVDDE